MAHGRSWIDAAEALTRAVNRVFALAASLLVAVIVAVVVREVVLRYGFNTPSTWALDAARYLLLFTFFLALAPALESGHHVHDEPQSVLRELANELCHRGQERDSVSSSLWPA